jgi:hypothetical protein
MRNKSLALCSALLLSTVLMSCGDSGNTPAVTEAVGTAAATETQAVEETDYRISDVLDDALDFGGEEVRFIVELGWSGIDQMYRSLYAEEDSPDIVDSAVYRRNLAVQEALNVKIADPVTTDPQKLLGEVNKVISAGDDVYDVVAGYQAYSASGSALNYFLNYEDVPHIDVQKPYWATNYIDAIGYRMGQKNPEMMQEGLELSQSMSDEMFSFLEDWTRQLQ